MTIPNLTVQRPTLAELNDKFMVISRLKLSDWPGEIGDDVIDYAKQDANVVFAGPSSGLDAAPAFRALVTADLPDNGVTNAKLRDSGATSVIGRSANSSGDPADISTSTDGQVLRRAAGVLGFGAVDLDDSDAVTGTLGLARGGTNADLSGTGGTSQFLRQNSAGADITVVRPAASDLSNGTTGTGSVVLATGPTVTALNVSDGDLEINAARIQSFSLIIVNTAGTMQHRIVAEISGLGSSNYVSKITGASSTLANTPQVAAGVDFVSGVGVEAAATSAVHFNVGTAQVAADFVGLAVVEYNDTGTAMLVRVGARSINVNGTTRLRLTFFFTNPTTGAAIPITTATFGAGTSIQVRYIGFLK